MADVWLPYHGHPQLEYRMKKWGQSLSDVHASLLHSPPHPPATV